MHLPDNQQKTVTSHKTISSATAEGPHDVLLVNSCCFTSYWSYIDFKQQSNLQGHW